MPEEDGLSIVRDLKARSPVPIIMLTATASPIDRIVGLELGPTIMCRSPANCANSSPASARSFAARCRRGPPPERAGRTAGPPHPHGHPWFDLDTAPPAGRRRQRAGPDAAPNSRCSAFADHPNRVLSRDRLLDLADARDPDAFDRSIDVRINRIRKKIEPTRAAAIHQRRCAASATCFGRRAARDWRISRHPVETAKRSARTRRVYSETTPIQSRPRRCRGDRACGRRSSGRRRRS